MLLEQIKEDPKAHGKPQQVLDKMLEGRMRKFFEESVLLKQAFVLNPDQTVEAAVDGRRQGRRRADRGQGLRPLRRRRGRGEEDR